jgi:hypothetical protein
MGLYRLKGAAAAVKDIRKKDEQIKREQKGGRARKRNGVINLINYRFNKN